MYGEESGHFKRRPLATVSGNTPRFNSGVSRPSTVAGRKKIDFRSATNFRGNDAFPRPALTFRQLFVVK